MGSAVMPAPMNPERTDMYSVYRIDTDGSRHFHGIMSDEAEAQGFAMFLANGAARAYLTVPGIGKVFEAYPPPTYHPEMEEVEARGHVLFALLPL